MPIYELTDDDLLRIRLDDGSVSDWLEVIGPPTLTAREFYAWYLVDMPPTSPGGSDPSDIDFRVWIAWHDDPDRIYFAVEAADDVYLIGEPASEFYYYDPFFSRVEGAVHLSVDGDHSGGDFLWSLVGNLHPELDNRQAQRYSASGEYDFGGRHLYLGRSDRDNPRLSVLWPLFPPYADGGGGHFGEQPTIWVTEFYVTPFDDFDYEPESSVVSDLYPGRVIGFDIALVDQDRVLSPFQDDRTLYYFQNHTSSADFFADGLLFGSPSGPAASGGPDVARSSWARIKASIDVPPAVGKGR